MKTVNTDLNLIPASDSGFQFVENRIVEICGGFKEKCVNSLRKHYENFIEPFARAYTVFEKLVERLLQSINIEEIIEFKPNYIFALQKLLVINRKKEATISIAIYLDENSRTIRVSCKANKLTKEQFNKYLEIVKNFKLVKFRFDPKTEEWKVEFKF